MTAPFDSVPNAGQTLGATRDQVRNNMDGLRSGIAVDHIDINLPDRGKHKFSHYVEQVSGPATSATEVAVYSLQTGGPPALFYRDSSNGTQHRISGNNNLGGNNGEFPLIGGGSLKCGTITSAPNGVSNYTFAGLGLNSFLGGIYSANSTSTGSGSTSALISNVTTTGFTLTVTSGPIAVYWMVIGT